MVGKPTRAWCLIKEGKKKEPLGVLFLIEKLLFLYVRLSYKPSVFCIKNSKLNHHFFFQRRQRHQRLRQKNHREKY